MVDETNSEKSQKAEIYGEESEEAETTAEEPLDDEKISDEPDQVVSNNAETARVAPGADEIDRAEPGEADTNGEEPDEAGINTGEPLVEETSSQESEESNPEPLVDGIASEKPEETDTTTAEPDQATTDSAAPVENNDKPEGEGTGSDEGVEADLTPALSQEPTPKSGRKKLAGSKVSFWRRLARWSLVLLAWLVRLGLIGGCLAVCYMVLNSTPHKDIYIQWTTTPLTVGVSVSLVLMVALRELLGQFRSKLAWQVRGWLNFLIPLMLLIFVSILLNKFNLVTSIG